MKRALLVLLLLGACTTNQAPLLSACNTYEQTLDATVTQAELNDWSLETLERIATVDATVAPICMGDLTAPDGTPVTPSEALRMVEDAYVEFLTLQQATP